MDTGENQQYKRNCPKCNIELTYSYKSSWVVAIKRNKTCRRCVPPAWKGRSHTEETKLKMSQSSPRTKSNLGKKFSDEHRRKISVANIGNKSRTGLPHTEETKLKMSQSQRGRIITKEHRDALSKSRSGYKVPPDVQERITLSLPRGEHHHNKKPENREKLRLSYLNRVENLNGSTSPFYNLSACKLFDEINKELNWNGLHAENVGEYKVRGWFLDYYEPRLNIAIEYDENYHKTSKRKNKDNLKEMEVIEALNCKFYRITPEQNWHDVLLKGEK